MGYINTISVSIHPFFGVKLHLLGATTAEVVVVVLPCTFATSLTLKSDPSSQIHIFSSCVLKSKYLKQSHFLLQTGIDLRILQLSSRVSFRDFVEPCDSTSELELLTIDGLRKLVSDIPAGKADGLDSIPTCLLKLSFPSIASSLTYILI